MPNLVGKTSAPGSVSPCFYPDDEAVEPSHPCFYPDDEPVELSHRDGNVNACFHPDDGDVNACFHPDLHLGLTGIEEQHLAALAAR